MKIAIAGPRGFFGVHGSTVVVDIDESRVELAVREYIRHIRGSETDPVIVERIERSVQEVEHWCPQIVPHV